MKRCAFRWSESLSRPAPSREPAVTNEVVPPPEEKSVGAQEKAEAAGELGGEWEEGAPFVRTLAPQASIFSQCPVLQKGTRRGWGT